MQARQLQNPSLRSSATNSCSAPMMFQCSNAVSTVSGRKTSAAEGTANTSSSLSSPEIGAGGLMAWSGSFSSPGAGPKGSSVGSIFLHRKCHALARSARPSADQYSLKSVTHPRSAI
jgi:hypothetical protein